MEESKVGFLTTNGRNRSMLQDGADWRSGGRGRCGAEAEGWSLAASVRPAGALVLPAPCRPVGCGLRQGGSRGRRLAAMTEDCRLERRIGDFTG